MIMGMVHTNVFVKTQRIVSKNVKFTVCKLYIEKMKKKSYREKLNCLSVM